MQSISSITLPTAQELTVETSLLNTPSLVSCVSHTTQTELREVPTNYINDYIDELLSYTDEEFEAFFRDKASTIIDYFANCPVWMSLEEWLFYEGNLKHFSYKTKALVNQIYNRSKISGYSFIKQYNLADKLNITDRYVREIVKNLQSLALVHKSRTNKIHYSLIFDLATKVTCYIESVVNILFNYYSKNNNVIASSVASSVASSSSFTDFSLVNVVYTGICELKKASQSKRTKICKTCKNKEHAGMRESESSSNITDLSFPNEESQSSLTSNIDKLTGVVRTLAESLSSILPNTNILDKLATLNTSSNNYQGNLEIEKTFNGEKGKSRYTLDECKTYTIEYAKFKVGSGDPIDSINAFAGWCYREGLQDIWIDDYFRTGKISDYTLEDYEGFSSPDKPKIASKPNNNNKLTNSKTDNKSAGCVTATSASASANASCLANDAIDSQVIDIINVSGISDVIDIVDVIVDGQNVEINEAVEVIEVVQSSNETNFLANKVAEQPQAVENTASNVINIADRLSDKSDNNAKESTRKPSFKELHIDTLDPKEVNGKYSFETYLDYILREESKRMEAKGKPLFSAEGLAKHLYTTGKDDVKVKAFVEKMRNLAVGARPGDLAGLAENKSLNSNDSNNNSNNSPNNVVGSVSKYDTNRGKDQQGNGIDFSPTETKESLEQGLAIAELEKQFWQSLDKQQISEITKIALAEYKSKYSNDLSLLAPDRVVQHVQDRLSRRVAKLAYSTKQEPRTALTNLGTELLNALSDDERAEMIEEFIPVFVRRTGIDYYKSDADQQKIYLNAIQMDIGINLAIANLIKG
jgi:hypothetical protein